MYYQGANMGKMGWKLGNTFLCFRFQISVPSFVKIR